MQVPFFGLDRQYHQYRAEFLEITERVLATGQVLQGKDVIVLEKSLSQICGRQDAVALGSCTDALAFALLAAGIGPGDEVLITSFSFFASVSPILRLGAVPRFVDIETDYCMMDLSQLDGLVTEKTKAILAVHIYGQTMPMTTVEDFANRHNLLLIEDAAQALGSCDNGRPAGSMGKISCISFDPTKVIGSFSSAGALLSDDPQICKTARALRYHGRNPQNRRYEVLGFNSQLSTEMAGHLNFKLSKLDEWIRGRERVAQTYYEGLSRLEQITMPKIRPGSDHNWHKFVLRVEDGRRDELAQFLNEHGIKTMLHYPSPMCDEPVVQALNLPEEAVNVPTARRMAESVLSLPIFPELTGVEAEYVVEWIKAFYNYGMSNRAVD